MANNTIKEIRIGDAIYIDIESLLDLRLGFIKLFYPSVYKKILEQPLPYLGRFTHRVYELLSIHLDTLYRLAINSEQIRKELLEHSYMTSLIIALNYELTLLELKNVNDKDYNKKPPTLDINLYPFNLTESEKSSLFLAIKKYLINRDIEVNFLYENPIQLTLDRIEAKYDTLFMYNGFEWLNEVYSVKAYSAPRVALFTPAIYNAESVDINEGKDLEEYFRGLQHTYEPIINLVFQPVEHFSIAPTILEKIKKTL